MAAQASFAQAMAAVSTNFAVIRSQLAAREQEVNVKLMSKQREEASLLQERRAALQELDSSSSEYDQFLSAMKKDKPSWGSPRYVVKSSHCRVVRACLQTKINVDCCFCQ